MNKLTTPDVATPMGRWRALAARCLDMAARGAVPSAAWRDALFTLFIAGILAYGAAFAWYMLARFDLINLIRDASEDDAFYYFQIARNLAEGKFSTSDGGITRTNGYHPIWLFLITPFYWVFDKEAALFAIKAFEIMLVAGGVALVAAAARLARMPWYLMFAALPMLYHIRALFRGLEAAAALFMLGLFILALVLFARSPARWKWPLAAIAFALPWVRLEYVAISLAATGALCLIEWSWRERAPGAPLGARARSVLSVKAVVPFLAAGAGILVYFAYNRLVFGGIVPVSAATKQGWSQNRWEQEGGYSFVQNFQDVLQIPVFDYELVVALEVCALFLLVWWFARRSRSRQDWLLLAFLAGVSGLAAGHLAKFAQTVLTVHPFFQGRFSWYFVPAYLMMALIIPVRCYVAIHFIRQFIGSRSQYAANILSLGVVVAGAIFLLAKVDFTSPFQRVEASSDSTRIVDQWAEAVYGGTRLMNRVLPDDSVVGSWDAGVIGYFSRFPVVNLDGVVNSYDYLRATNMDRDGYPAWDDRFHSLYRQFGITHFTNLTRMGFEGKVLFEGSIGGIQRIGSQREVIYIWPIEPLEDANTAAGVWKRLEPHFDHRSDGVGLIVDGRLAQAFARKCDPVELAVWSWAGPGEGTVAKAWTRTQTGLCVAAAVMPRTISNPIRIETMSAGDYLTRLTGGSPPVIRSDWDVYLVEDSLIYAKDQSSPEDAGSTFSLLLDPVDLYGRRIRSRFNVYLDQNQNRLIYTRDQCTGADLSANFLLRLFPVDVDDLPDHRKQHGFDKLDFRFDDYRVRHPERCVAARPLPDYAITGIRTGQYVVREDGSYENFWKAEYHVERLECAAVDLSATFFLHLIPVDVNDLPSHRKQYGFDNLDFAFRDHRLIEGGVCVARRELPDYAIAAIRTGQYTGEGQVWKGSFDLTGSADNGKAAP